MTPIPTTETTNRSRANQDSHPPSLDATTSQGREKQTREKPDNELRLPLIDGYGRHHRSLRVSVTDRCNIRCQYCMPATGAQFLSESRLLPFEQIATFVRIVATLGISEVRITGGEPLMRPKLHELLRMIRETSGLENIAVTTNGMMLAEQLPQLIEAGLKRVNISLDTLSEETFKKLSRRDGLDRVLAGIEAALDSKIGVRLNALVMRSVNLSEVVPLVEFARGKNLPIRFIEFMPLDAERAWTEEQMVSGMELRQLLEARFGPLQAAARIDSSQPSSDFTFTDGTGMVGFIDSVTQPFCQNCDRLRLTADGKLRNCLFSSEEWDLRHALSQCTSDSANNAASSREAKHLEPQASEVQVLEIVRQCIAAKKASHGMDSPSFSPPERAMFQIGG